MPALEELPSWDVERRADGAVLVRVHSTGQCGRQLPDAVFAFRPGDPQYEFWQQQLQTRAECSMSVYAGQALASAG